MHNEQVFTPEHVVDTMFEELEYKGNKIRKKHIIDNSCGNGAILKKVVRTYINVCIMCGLSKEETIEELETYIHGIEIDGSLVKETIDNLNKIAEEYSLGDVNWDVTCADALFVREYDNRMDYVIGNPPYCNIHDIPEDKREWVKQYKFANGGMTDMYLVFFEIGINMLNENGKLAYITPNSWLTSKAGTNFRNYLKESRTLLEIYQYGHKKVFENVNTYNCITFLCKKPKSNNVFICYRNIEHQHGLEKLNKMLQTVEDLDECMINGMIYLTDKNTLKVLSEIDEINRKTKKDKNRIRVKNGFATLNDKFFIIDDYENKTDKNILLTHKASNGETHFFFYPYDEKGKPMSLLDINDKLVGYMRDRAFEYGVDVENSAWYLYGRTQALNDVKYDKIIVNNLIRREGDIKVKVLLGQQGVYSGFYIPLYNKDKEYAIIRFIECKEFVNYIKAVGKYKSGGYYTFSSKELEAWLNYCMEKTKETELLTTDLEYNWYKI